jgi:hypothetical protein
MQMKQPPISNDVNQLSPAFKKKFDLFWKEVKTYRPDAHVFEAKRSPERQLRLWNESNRREKLWQPRLTRTMKSKHLTGDAVDIVFMDDVSTPHFENKPMWKWPYDKLIEISKKYGIKNLKPTETCHFEDDGTPLSLIQPLMLVFEKIYKDKFSKVPDTQKITAQVANRYGMVKDKTTSQQIEELTWLIAIKVEELNQKLKPWL